MTNLMSGCVDIELASAYHIQQRKNVAQLEFLAALLLVCKASFFLLLRAPILVCVRTGKLAITASIVLTV